MKKERREFKRVEYKDVFIAGDGTEFSSEDECKKYEESAEYAVEVIVDKIPKQVRKCIGQDDPFYIFGCDDNLVAYKIRNMEDVEAINRWLRVKYHCGDNSKGVFLGSDAIGTIQMFNLYDYDNVVWRIGSPDDFKQMYINAINKLYDSLIEKSDEGEKA